VVGGLLVVAAGLAGLSFAYWRGTRPGMAPAGAAAAAEVDMPDRADVATGVGPLATVPAAAVPAAAVPAAAVAGAATAPMRTPGPVLDAATIPPTSGAVPAAEVDPLVLLLSGVDPVTPVIDPPAASAPEEPSAGAPARTATPAPAATPAPTPASPSAPAAAAPPVQSSGVRVMGPVAPAAAAESPSASHAGEAAPSASEQTAAPPASTPGNEPPPALVTREDLDLSDAAGA